MNIKEEDDVVAPIGGAAGYESDVSVSPIGSPQTVKEEEGIKAEQGSEDGAGSDDDRYEDTLDLDTSKSHNKVWLVRMPRFLLEEIDNNLGEVGGQELGKVRIQTVNGQPGRVRVLLNQNIAPLQSLPHRYDLTMTQPQVDNTYLFKEQDLPKSKKRSGDDQPYHSANAKRTALSGKVAHEFNLVPDFADPNYRNVLQQRREMELPQMARRTTLLDGASGVGGVKYGTTLRQQRETWLRPQQRRQVGKTSTDGKATRISRNELLDLLFRLFEEMPHWTLKALRERTKQPEVYLREVLDSIAFLNKRGPFAMRYGLRDEFRQLQTSGASVQDMVEKAPQPVAEGPAGSDKEESGDEEDLEMETVAL